MSSSDDDTDPFSFNTRLGLVFIVESAFLSAISVSALLVYIAYSTLKLRRSSSRRWSTGTHVHYYFVSLLISDLIQAIGGILNIRWIQDAAVVDGTLCQVQGIFKQLGDVGVALASLAIAVHTFSVLVLHWKPSSSPRIALFVLACIWVLLALIIGISAATHKGKEYWDDTQYWCWISSSYPVQRIVLEYLWLWITCFSNIVLYVPIMLVLKGILIVDGWSVRLLRRSNILEAPMSATPDARDANTIAMQMLFYPAVYILTVLPISVIRWISFTDSSVDVPFAATVFADTLFASSGVLNVLLFSVTRPSLIPRRPSRLRKMLALGNINDTFACSHSQDMGIGSQGTGLNIGDLGSVGSMRTRSMDADHELEARIGKGSGSFKDTEVYAMQTPERAFAFRGILSVHPAETEERWRNEDEETPVEEDQWVYRPQPLGHRTG